MLRGVSLGRAFFVVATVLLWALIVRHSLAAYGPVATAGMSNILPSSARSLVIQANEALGDDSEEAEPGRLSDFATLPGAGEAPANVEQPETSAETFAAPEGADADAASAEAAPAAEALAANAPPPGAATAPAPPAEIAAPASRATSADIIRAWCVEALRRAPLNNAALADLGQLQARAGDAAGAQVYYEASVKRSIRQRTALSWLLSKKFESQDYPTTLEYIDALLRGAPQQVRPLSPYLGRIAEDEKSSAQFIELMKQNPAWRPGFFANMKGTIADARTPMKILLELKESNAPPTRGELQSYVSLLINNKLYELAYNAWLQFLPPENLGVAGFVYNGSFEFPSENFPFDWNVSKGFRYERVGRVDEKGSSALRIDFTGARTGMRVLSQMLLLQPGQYTLKGSTRNEAKARRGLKWSILCADSAQQLADSEALALTTGWTNFEVAFNVPRESCRAQMLRLNVEARSSSETMILGSVLIDDIAIARAESPSQPSEN